MLRGSLVGTRIVRLGIISPWVPVLTLVGWVAVGNLLGHCPPGPPLRDRAPCF